LRILIILIVRIVKPVWKDASAAAAQKACATLGQTIDSASLSEKSRQTERFANKLYVKMYEAAEQGFI
jgi:uncharacterized cupredoxin-like copper-binding protein